MGRGTRVGCSSVRTCVTKRNTSRRNDPIKLIILVCQIRLPSLSNSAPLGRELVKCKKNNSLSTALRSIPALKGILKKRPRLFYNDIALSFQNQVHHRQTSKLTQNYVNFITNIMSLGFWILLKHHQERSIMLSKRRIQKYSLNQSVPPNHKNTA